MKILSIVWYKILPARFGGQKGIAHFNEGLAEWHPLVCLCSRNNEAPPGLPYRVIPTLPVSKSQIISPRWWLKIAAIARSQRATHIILEHPYHGIAAVWARNRTGAMLIVHSHNIESDRFRRLGKWWWRILAAYERWVHRRSDLSLFKTATDLDYAVKHFRLDPANCMIMPYPVLRPEAKVRSEAVAIIRRRHHIPGNEKILLFAGTLDYEPNALAVQAIYAEIAPRLARAREHIRIVICGRNKFEAFQYLKDLSHPLVIDAGEVDDIENYFAGADLFINPVQWSGGVQTKNIDALAYSLPVVCFRLEGQPADEEWSAFISEAEAGDWDTFVSKIIHQLYQPRKAIPEKFFEKNSSREELAKFAASL